MVRPLAPPHGYASGSVLGGGKNISFRKLCKKWFWCGKVSNLDTFLFFCNAIFLIFYLDNELNPVVEDGKPIDVSIPMEKFENNLNKDNSNETQSFLQKGLF